MKHKSTRPKLCETKAAKLPTQVGGLHTWCCALSLARNRFTLASWHGSQYSVVSSCGRVVKPVDGLYRWTLGTLIPSLAAAAAALLGDALLIRPVPAAHTNDGQAADGNTLNVVPFRRSAKPARHALTAGCNAVAVGTGFVACSCRWSA